MDRQWTWLMREREDRVVTMLGARMRAGDDWRDVTILNASRHGLMLRSEEPMSRGSYIEVRRGAIVIVGRVVWSKAAHFGVRAQDVIDLPDLIAVRKAAPTAWIEGGADRRKVRRKPAVNPDRQVALGRQLQFAAVVIAILCSCMILTKMVTSSFNAAMVKIGKTL